MGCIYYHKNKINGAMYIGQSIAEPETIVSKRWGLNGEGYKNSSFFWNAIVKYGWNNFEHGFFEINVPKEQLSIKEKYYIQLYHTCRQDPSYEQGYNLTFGGEESICSWLKTEDTWLMLNWSPNIKYKELVANFKKTFPNTYHSNTAIIQRLKDLRLIRVIPYWTEEEINILKNNWSKLSMEEIKLLLPSRSVNSMWSKAKELGLKRHVDVNPNYSKEELQIIIDNYTEFGVDYCRTLIKERYNLDRSYNSVKDTAIKKLKLKRNLKKFTNEAGFDSEKFKELYYFYGIKTCMQEFNLKQSQVVNLAHKYHIHRKKGTIKTSNAARKVFCIELNKVFNSAKEAALSLNFSNSNGILECCKGNRKTSNGYHWKFADNI